MSVESTTAPPRGAARARLLDAAVDVIRAQGYAATTVDDLCRSAGVTKGAFFHHFASKDTLAVAAAEHWGTTTAALFETAPYHQPALAVDRLLAYVDFRASLIAGGAADYSCLVGTMTQEAYRSNDAIRAACAASIFGHAATLEADFDEALADAGSPDGVTAGSLARHTQAVLQGAFILGKAAGDTAPVLESIGHLRRYLELLLDEPVEAVSDTSRPRRAT